MSMSIAESTSPYLEFAGRAQAVIEMYQEGFMKEDTAMKRLCELLAEHKAEIAQRAAKRCEEAGSGQ